MYYRQGEILNHMIRKNNKNLAWTFRVKTIQVLLVKTFNENSSREKRTREYDFKCKNNMSMN